MDAIDRALLNAIQNHFPIVVHPYQFLGEAVGTTEEDAFRRIQRLRRDGIIRRLGGVLDSRRLGYYSTLCTAKVPAEKFPCLTELLEKIPGVTHNYIRDHSYNSWFTLIARSQEAAERILQTIRESSGIMDIFSLPATRLFKIQVKFDLTDEDIDEEDLNEEETTTNEEAMTQAEHMASDVAETICGTPRENGTPYALSQEDIVLIQVLQGNLPDSPTPFTDLAETLHWRVEDVISRTGCLIDAKVIRRFGAVLRHQQAGFLFNAMGVWQVAPEQAAEVGKTMASFKEVSHCYQRPTLPDWPYNLFTMVHGRTLEECEDIMKRISLATGVKTYSMLLSTAELKKSSMQYFLEDTH